MDRVSHKARDVRTVAGRVGRRRQRTGSDRPVVASSRSAQKVSPEGIRIDVHSSSIVAILCIFSSAVPALSEPPLMSIASKSAASCFIFLKEFLI